MRHRGSRRPLYRADDGFTVVEVVVAVVLLAVVMTAVAAFFVSAVSSSASLQRRDAASQLADEAMELVRAAPPIAVGSAAPLVKGRTQTAVQAQWPSRPPELSGAAPVWDTSAGSTSVPVVPLSVTRRVGQQPYTVETFIGSCRQVRSSTSCTETATDGALHYRVSVRVAWDPGAGEDCSGRACEYVLTTLVNADGEPLYDTIFDLPRPVAAPDSYTVDAGASVNVALLGNDSGTFAINPVTILGTGPANGALTGTTASGSFTYTANASFAGVDTFRYRVTDTNGITSEPGTVSVTVVPRAADDAATTTWPAAVEVDVRTNDHAVFRTGTVTVTANPTRGSATVLSNGRIRYTPNLPGVRNDVLQYRVAAGGFTATATLRVTVGPPTVPTVGDVAVSARCSEDVRVDATLRVLSGATQGGGFAVTAPSRWWSVTGPPGGGVTLRWTGDDDDLRAGTYSFRYTFTDAWNQASAERLLRLTLTGECDD